MNIDQETGESISVSHVIVNLLEVASHAGFSIASLTCDSRTASKLLLPRFQTGRSPRFTLWLAFFAFATITMGSSISVVSFLIRTIDSCLRSCKCCRS